MIYLVESIIHPSNNWHYVWNSAQLWRALFAGDEYTCSEFRPERVLPTSFRPEWEWFLPEVEVTNWKEIFPSWKNISPFHLSIQSEKKTKVISQSCMPRTNVTCPETMLKLTSCHFHWEPSEKRGLKMFIEKLWLWSCFHLQHLINFSRRSRSFCVKAN